MDGETTFDGKVVCGGTKASLDGGLGCVSVFLLYWDVKGSWMQTSVVL